MQRIFCVSLLVLSLRCRAERPLLIACVHVHALLPGQYRSL